MTIENQEIKNHIRLAHLIAKMRCDDLTEIETKELKLWEESGGENRSFIDSLTTDTYSEIKDDYKSIDVDKQWDVFCQKRKPQKSNFSQLIGLAASIILIVGGIYIFKGNGDDYKVTANRSKLSDVCLKLADGREINLSDEKNCIIDSSRGVLIEHRNNQLNYSIKGKYTSKLGELDARKQIEKNTVTVPRASAYNLVLSDGTKVWLNSESELTYPVDFIGKKRLVQLSGEAYFEVAKDETKPFVIETNQIKVKVLGTKFAINTYGDDGIISTTLVEGKVEVFSQNGKCTSLDPGERLELDLKTQNIEVKKVNVDPYISWKNGDLCFRSTSLMTLLKQVERAYDVRFQFKKGCEREFYSGEIRNKSLEEILNALQLSTSVSFVNQGDIIIVE